MENRGQQNISQVQYESGHWLPKEGSLLRLDRCQGLCGFPVLPWSSWAVIVMITSHVLWLH